MQSSIYNEEWTACNCVECMRCCHYRVCWPTPEEAEKLIELGYTKRLMNDWWVGDGPDGEDIQLLCPASSGYEGDYAPSWPADVKCTFLTEDNLCEIHNSGAKPMEGRLSLHGEVENLHETVATLWNNPEAQDLVRKWRNED